MPFKTDSRCVTSWRFAPVATSDNGTPRPSTSRCRFVPFFPPVGRISTDCVLRQGSLDHRPVNALPAPNNPFHVIVLSKPRTPECDKESSTHPIHEMGMDSAAASKSFLGQSFPLASCPKHIHNGLKDLAWRHRFFTSAGLAFICFFRIALSCWYKRFNLCPKSIGYFP